MLPENLLHQFEYSLNTITLNGQLNNPVAGEYAKLINNSKISLITTGPGDLVGTRYFEVSASHKSLIMCNRMPDQIYNKMMIDKFNCIMFEDEFDFKPDLTNESFFINVGKYYLNNIYSNPIIHENIFKKSNNSQDELVLLTIQLE